MLDKTCYDGAEGVGTFGAGSEICQDQRGAKTFSNVRFELPLLVRNNHYLVVNTLMCIKSLIGCTLCSLNPDYQTFLNLALPPPVSLGKGTKLWVPVVSGLPSVPKSEVIFCCPVAVSQPKIDRLKSCSAAMG